MRIFAFVLALLLSACAAPKYDPRFAEFTNWNMNAKSQALAGERSFSSYYLEAYERLQALPSDPFRNIAMQTMNELIPLARLYDSGQITREQLDDFRRDANTRSQEKRDRIYSQQREIEASNRAESAASFASGMQLLMAAQPKAMPMPVQPIHNNSQCTSRRDPVNGNVYTDCR